MRRRLPSRARVAALAVLVALALASCAEPEAGTERAEAARTCASLRERLTGRALDDPGLFGVQVPDPKDPASDPLGPAAFADDPEAWYAALAQALAAADFGPSDTPSSVSPASRLVRTCQELDR